MNGARQHASFGTVATLVVIAVLVSPSRAAAETKSVLSPTYKVDRIIRSMEGPQSAQDVTLLAGLPPELVWITGLRTEMVGADGKTPALADFMCHVNLDFDVAKHRELLESASSANTRIFTLSQGQSAVRFPKGFGMPVMSNEALSLATQVLNHNLPDADLEVRHRVTFDFVRDRDLAKSPNALLNASVFGMKLLDGAHGHFGVGIADEATHGPGCLPGDSAVPNATVYEDATQQKFTGHWVVKPGREVSHTNVTRQLNLPFDTTLHYAAVHLHPYAESLELRDRTTGETVFASRARNHEDRIGLAHVDSFESEGGVPMFRDHEYELVSTYDNPTASDQDSMAVMLLFLLDRRFEKPSRASTAARE